MRHRRLHAMLQRRSRTKCCVACGVGGVIVELVENGAVVEAGAENAPVGVGEARCHTGRNPGALRRSRAVRGVRAGAWLYALWAPAKRYAARRSGRRTAAVGGIVLAYSARSAHRAVVAKVCVRCGKGGTQCACVAMQR